MQSVSNTNFGPLIAYLVPGATALWGLSLFSPPIQTWFAATPANTATIGGFLYLTIASLAVGMTVTAIRWALIDMLHAATGLKQPNLDFSKLHGRVDAFNLLIEIHYRHYQYYANMFVATAIAYVCYKIKVDATLKVGWTDLGIVLLETVFFMTSRNTLRNYHQRTWQLLAARPRRLPSRRARSTV